MFKKKFVGNEYKNIPKKKSQFLRLVFSTLIHIVFKHWINTLYD